MALWNTEGMALSNTEGMAFLFLCLENLKKKDFFLIKNKKESIKPFLTFDVRYFFFIICDHKKVE